MRKIPALFAATALVATLSACTAAGPATIDGCTLAYDGGSTVDLVSATGALGAAPDVDFPTPLVTDGAQRVTLVEGSGTPAAEGSQVAAEFTIYAGSAVVPLGGTSYDASSPTLIPAETENPVPTALICAQAGERFALTMTAGEAYGEGTLETSGIADDETLVFVFDVAAVYLGKADGVNQLPVDGMPTVVTAVDGTPGISVPTSAPPTELQIATIKLGGGATVAEGDQIVAHYSVWNWPAAGGEATASTSSWSEGTAATFTVSSDELPEGFLAAVTGAPVGSQLLVVSPPATEGEANTIMVIDVLGIVE